MSITNISRDWGESPSIVRVTTTDSLATITTVGYLTTQETAIDAIQNGSFEWLDGDIVAIDYSDGEGLFTRDATNNTFIAFPSSPGSLSNTLANTHIFVGNASNVATGVAMSGDATMANTGALTIASGAVTGSKIANNAVDFTQLALDVAATATVSLTAAQIKALYDTPVQLVAAPGAGKLILIDSITWDIAYGAAQFTAGGVIAAQYANTVHGGGAPASGTIAAATLNSVAANTLLSVGPAAINVATATAENAGVFLSNATADFATGDSTATLYVKYRVITPA